MTANTVMLVLTPVLTGLIGWFTNWVAIEMLFRPRNKTRVLFWEFQGLVPKRQAELARECADIIEKELLHQRMLEDAVARADISGELEAGARRLIGERLAVRLREIPFIGGFITPQSIRMIEDMAVKEILAEGPVLLRGMATKVSASFPIREIVEQRIASFDLDRLEAIVKSVSKREFKTIEWLGGVLGFLIGLLQVLFYTLGQSW